MKQNIGTTERIIRILLGLVIIAAGYYYSSWWGLIGIIPLATGLIRYCPAWHMFGINTCQTKIKS